MQPIGRFDDEPYGGPDGMVCYCFGFTAGDIEQDYLTHGHSTILEKIRAAKRTSGCQCEVKNPKGR